MQARCAPTEKSTDVDTKYFHQALREFCEQYGVKTVLELTREERSRILDRAQKLKEADRARTTESVCQTAFIVVVS